MVTAADVFAQAKGNQATARLLFDSELRDRHEHLQAQLDKAVEHDAEASIAQQIVEVEAEIRDHEVVFVFQAFGRGRWRKLLADHPPSDEEKKAGADFSIDSFPFEAMARSLVDPRMTVDELKKLNDEILTLKQYNVLWATCLEANLEGGVTHPESLAALAILANGRHRSTPPSDSESAAAS